MAATDDKIVNNRHVFGTQTQAMVLFKVRKFIEKFYIM